MLTFIKQVILQYNNLTYIPYLVARFVFLFALFYANSNYTINNKDQVLHTNVPNTEDRKFHCKRKHVWRNILWNRRKVRQSTVFYCYQIDVPQAKDKECACEYDLSLYSDFNVVYPFWQPYYFFLYKITRMPTLPFWLWTSNFTKGVP